MGASEQEAIREMDIHDQIKDHPNIIGLFGYGVHQGSTIFIFLEFASLGPLDKLDISGNSKAFFSLASDLSSGLDYMHSKGFLHRDLKPENVLVFKEGFKLTDFGLAKAAVEVERDDALRGTEGFHPICDNSVYLSEHLQSPATDIYALGFRLNTLQFSFRYTP